MDIAKYIGLFLLKNKYCCLQGLGNVEIKKSTATMGQNEINAGSFYATLDPVGAIDDSFPNFVANNEHVSIAKATNEISEFIRESKKLLATGASVTIPSVGQYIIKDNKLNFELDPHFVLPTKPMPFTVAEHPLSTLTETKTGDEPSFEAYNNFEKQRAVNWNIVAFWGVIILIGGSILGWGIKYFMSQNSSLEVVEPQPQINVATLDTAVNTIDSAALNNTTDSAAAGQNANVNSSDTPSFTFVLKTCNTFAKAEKRQKQLAANGYNVSVQSIDSTIHLVTTTLKVMAIDTSRVKDSLTKLLNPAGVTILSK